MVATIVIALLSLLMCLWGVQLKRGRLLNTIAGNNLASEEDFSKAEQIGLGKRVGNVMFSASVLTLFLAFSLFFGCIGRSDLGDICMILMFASIVPLLFFVILAFKWSLTHMR